MDKKEKKSGRVKKGLDTAGKRLLVLTIAILMTFQFCTPTFSGVSFADEETAEAVGTVTEEAQADVQETETPVPEEQTVVPEVGDASEESAAEATVEEQPVETAPAETEPAPQVEPAAPEVTNDLNTTPMSLEVKTKGGVKVNVVAEAGTFPVGTQMKVTEVAADDVQGAVDSAMGGNATVLKAVDITFYNDKETDIQPAIPVKVKVTSDEFNAASDMAVVHITDAEANDAEVVALDENRSTDTTAAFNADGFSVYVVVDTGADARLKVTFMNGETEIASTIVKQSDIDSGIFNQIVYDPGAGELGDGEVFRGWTIKEEYTTDDIDSGMTIDGVRDAVKAKLNAGVTEVEGEPATMEIHAMVFRAVNITYKDEDGVVIRNEAILTSRDATGEIEYQVNEAYVPKTSDQEFQGWYFTSSAAVKDADGNTIPEGSVIANESTVKITADLVLTVDAPKGAWLIFKENGQGASYTSPQFLEGEKPEVPTAPTRFGHTFGGWYTDEACTDGNEFDFDQVLTSTTTVYAKWIENETANYTVIIWKQNVAGDGYDFAESTTLSGNVGDTVTTVTASGSGDGRYASVNGEAKRWTGFHLDKYDQNVTIKVDGTSVVNVYYNRNTVTLTFMVYEGGYWDGSWQEYTTMSGLYGSTLASNGYTWPTDYWWRDNPNSGTRTTFLDAFILSDGSSNQTFYGYDGDGQRHVYWYKQNADGTWPALNSSTNDATASRGTFNISDKYNGYHVVSYSTNGTSWTTVSGKNAQGYYAAVETYSNLYIRCAPDLYNIQFTDGVYVDGNGVAVEGYSSRGELKVEKDVPYASDIKAYNKGQAKYYEPTFEGFVFEGWYLDDKCTQPCQFTNMPEGMQVYAKWVQKQYRVFLHPEVPTSDTSLSMGGQATSFRIDYNDSINAIDARRADYELVGWYTDEACTHPFNFDAYVLNDTTVTTPYDQTQPTETDTYGNPTENINKDADNNRFWIEKKLDLYAKWRSKLIGANGITVVYDAADGSFAGGKTTYTDPLTYKDLAKAVATTASTPTDTTKKEFESWMIQKWNGSDFEDAGDTVLPGDSFEVLKAYTQQTENEDSTEEKPSYTYTFKLVAQYKDIEEETTTHITWYANNKTDASKNDDGLKMNQAIDIEPATLFTYTGYDFVGWARYEEGKKPSSPTDDTNMWLYYNKDDNKFYTDSAFTKEAKQVACDEKNPYHDLYAVWEAKDVDYKVEYYFQSAAGSEEYAKDETIRETATRTAKTDSTVEVTAGDKAAPSNKYVLNETKNENWSATVAGDGSTVLRVYFDLNEAEVTVHHYLKGTTTKVADDETTSKTIGSEYSATPVTKYQEKNLTVDSYNPSQKVTVSEEGNVITIYYTLPLTIEAKSDSKKYDGEPLDGEYTVTGALASDETAINTALGTAPSITDVGTKDYLTEEEQAEVTGIPGYYVVEYIPGTLEITKRTVTLTSADDEKVYDGTALTNDEVTVGGDGFAEGEGASYDVTGTQTDAGESPNAFTYTLNEGTKEGNYTITKVEGTLKVTELTDKVTVTIKENSGSEKYDGAEKTVKGYTVEISNPLYKEADFTFSGNDTVKGTDAGSYPMELKPADFVNTNENFTNVEFVIVDGTLEIAKRTVTLTSADDEKVYDGTALTNDEITVGGDGFVEGEGASYDVTGTQTDAGESANAFTYTLNEGTKADNYTITKVEGTLKVTPVTDKVTVTITENSGSAKYDAKDHTIDGYESMVADNDLYDVTTSVEETKTADWTVTEKDAGSYDMGIAAKDFQNTNENFSNVEFVIVDGTLEISKRTVTLTSATDSKVYDGTALTNDIVTVGGDGFVEGEGAVYDVTGTQTDKGTSNNTFDYTLNEGTKADNYTITKTEGTLTVTATEDEVVVTITENSGTEKYDGTEKTVTGYEVTSISNPLYTEDDFSFSGDANVKGTDAGTYPMELKATDFANISENFSKVTFQIVDGTLTIEKRTVTLTSEDGEKVYDGTALTNKEVIIGGEGFAEGEGATYDITGSQTDVGESQNTFSYTLNENTKAANYDITQTPGTLKVTPVTEKVTVTITENSGNEKYDGAEKTVTGYEVTSISNPLYKEADFTFSGDATVKGTDAGTYPMELKAADFKNVSDNFSNVEFVIVDGTLEIAKRTVTLTSADAEKVYDGQPLTNSTVTAGGDGFAKGEGASYDVTGTQTDAGESANAFTYTLNERTKAANYEITTTEGTLKVTPVTETVTVTITGNKDEQVYNGSEQKVEGYTVEISNPLYKEADFTFSGEAIAKGTNKGTYNMGLAEEQFKNISGNFTNVVFEVTDGELVIAPRKIKIESASDEKVYDGTALTNDTVTITEGDLAPTDELTNIEVTGSQTLVGTSKNTFTFDIDTKAEPASPAGKLLSALGLLDIAYGSEEVLANYDITKVEGDLTVTDKGVDPDDVITKTHEDKTYKVGETITFTIKATNIYDDVKTITLTEQEGVTLTQSVFEDVEPGEEIETTATYTVTEEDAKAGTFKNTVKIEFSDEDEPIENTDEVDDFAHMTVTKEVTNKPADGKVFRTGETIKYEVTVTNDGTAEMKDIVVKDELTGDEWKVDSLAAGKSKTFKAEYKVTEADAAAGSVTNVATAEGKDPEGDTTPGTPGKVVTDTDKAVEIPKTGDTTVIAPYIVIGAASLALLLMLLFRRRKAN